MTTARAACGRCSRPSTGRSTSESPVRWLWGARCWTGSSCFSAPSAAAVCALMVSSLSLTLVDAAASSPARFSAGYLAKLEAHSPFRLESLTAQRLRVSRAQGSLTGLLETWLGTVPDAEDGLIED